MRVDAQDDPVNAAVADDGKRGRMIGGLGDANILQHDRIEPELGEAWRRIQWPRPLDPATCALARELGYEVEEVRLPDPAYTVRLPEVDAIASMGDGAVCSGALPKER